MLHWFAALAAALCPSPQVTDLSVRPASEDGMRVTLRGRAEVQRGRIGSITVSWGDRSALIADLGGRRRMRLRFLEHRYAAADTYRITVRAESSTPNCRRYRTSAPAALRIHLPVRPTSRPSSL